MILYVLATRDIKANVYGTPMFVPHIGQHIRAFGDECQREDRNNPLWMHPEDYELVQLGEWDDTTGAFLTYDNCPEGADDTRAWGTKQLAVGSNYKR